MKTRSKANESKRKETVKLSGKGCDFIYKVCFKDGYQGISDYISTINVQGKSEMRCLEMIKKRLFNVMRSAIHEVSLIVEKDSIINEEETAESKPKDINYSPNSLEKLNETINSLQSEIKVLHESINSQKEELMEIHKANITEKFNGKPLLIIFPKREEKRVFFDYIEKYSSQYSNSLMEKQAAAKIAQKKIGFLYEKFKTECQQLEKRIKSSNELLKLLLSK